MSPFPAFSILSLFGLITLVLLLSTSRAATVTAENRVMTLGIFSYSEDKQVQQCCAPIIRLLNERLEGFKLELKPINLSQLPNPLVDNELDFLITNPAHFIQLRKRYQLEGALASVIRLSNQGKYIRHTGGVIIASRERNDIRALDDVRGKWIAIAGTRHLGGYEAPAYELLQAGIDLPGDARLVVTGSFPAVVEAVLSGSVDIGFLPTGWPEHLQAAGVLDLNKIKIINARQQPGFPLLLSTKLYPQWPVVAMPHVSHTDSDAFLQALLSISDDIREERSANVGGFAPAADYRSVEAIMRALKMPPFDDLDQITLAEIWRQHYFALTTIGFAIVIIVVLLQLLLLRNRQLRQQQQAAQRSAIDFEQIIDATRAGTWKWELASDQLIVNKRWAEMLGYANEDQCPAQMTEVFELIHEQDQGAVRNNMEQHLGGRSTHIDMRFRMRHRKGHWIWVHCRAQITHWWADGSPQWVFGTHTDVTKRMRAELELQKSQAKYQRLIDNIGEKFIIYSHSGQNGIINYVSDGVFQIFGMPKEQIIGKEWSSVVEWLPEDLQKARESVRARALGQYDFIQFEMRFIHPDGDLRTLRISSHAVRDAQGQLQSIDGLAEDITEQKRSQERALMAATVLAHSQESIIITDTEGRIIDCNPATTPLTGYSREEIIGSKPSLFKSGTHPQPFYRAIWQTLLANKVWEGSICNRHKNGNFYWVESSISPIKDDNGVTTHYVSVSRDATRKKQQLQSLRQAKRDAQAANAAKTAFVANISHELRTPMNAVLGFTNLSLEHELPAKPRKYLQNVRASALNMLSLINEILDFSKIEAGKLTVEAIPFDLSLEMEQIVSVVRPLIEDKPVELSLELDTRLSGKLVGDPLRLKQVLTNLASNAVKFTEQGRIRISVVEQNRDDDQVELEFSVCDTGIGMTLEATQQVFLPFSQADDSTTRRFGGTGLGLAIASELVHKMGGHIDVQSEPQIGSIFYFTLKLPLATELELDTAPVSDQPLQRSFHHLANTRALLVEDNQINCELVSEILHRYQIHVDIAENGLEALQRLEENDYDIVLMDIQMPIMDGFQATRAIRDKLHLRTLPVIALTANAGSTVREECMRAGLDDYLSKPIDMIKLLTKIDDILNPVLSRITRDSEYMPFSKTDPESEVKQNFPALVDSQEALARLGLEENTLSQLLRTFANRHRDEARQLCQLIEEQRWEPARSLAHTQKGLCATLGMHQLSTQLAELERSLKLKVSDTQSVSRERITQQAMEACRTFEQAIRQIDAMDDKPNDSPNNSTTAHHQPPLATELRKLLTLVEQYDVLAVEKANELLSHPLEETVSSSLRSILNELENYDFENSSNRIKKLLSNL